MQQIATLLSFFLSLSIGTSQELIKEFRLQDHPQHLDVKDIIPTENGYSVIADRSSFEFGIEGPQQSYLSVIKLSNAGEIMQQQNFETINKLDADYGGSFHDKIALKFEGDLLFFAIVRGEVVAEEGLIKGHSGALSVGTYDLQNSSIKHQLLPDIYHLNQQIRLLDLKVIHEDSIHLFVAPLRYDSGEFFDEFRINVRTGAYEMLRISQATHVRNFRLEVSGSLMIRDSFDMESKIVNTQLLFESASGSVYQYNISNRTGELRTKYIDGEFYVLIDQKILRISNTGHFSFLTESIPSNVVSDFTVNTSAQTIHTVSRSTHILDTIPQVSTWSMHAEKWSSRDMPGDPHLTPSTISIIDDQIVVGGHDLQYLKYWDELSSGYSDSSHIGNGIIRFLDMQFTTPTVDIDKNDFAVSIFPNPAHDHVMVRSPEKMSRIQVFDYAGRLVQDIQNLQLEAYQLSVADLQPGTYQLRISAEVAGISSVPLLVH